MDMIFIDAGAAASQYSIVTSLCCGRILYIPTMQMLLLRITARENQLTFWNDRYQSCFHFTTSLASNSTDLNPLDYKRWEEMQQRAYQVTFYCPVAFVNF